MVQTRRMNSDKSVKLKSENITLKKKTKKNSQHLNKSLKPKSGKITKKNKVQQNKQNPCTSIDEMLKLCKPFSIRLNRIEHIPTAKSKFENIIDEYCLFLRHFKF